MSDIDLDMYFDRIGYTGPVEPSLETLQGVIRHHATAIPFENIDIVAGRSIRIDRESVISKLVKDRRGGYCFEQNTLLRAALEMIGFRVAALIGRVRRGAARDEERPQTHLLLRVDLPEGAWLADAGFGGFLSAPLAMTPNLEQETPDGIMRLVPTGSDLMLQALMGGDWADMYQFSPEPVPAIDFEVANWFTATHPGSLFRTNVIATKPEDGSRIVLFNRAFTRRWKDGSAEKHTLADEADYYAVLTEVFRLPVTDQEIDAIMALLADQAPVSFDPFN